MALPDSFRGQSIPDDRIVDELSQDGERPLLRELLSLS